MRLNEEAIVDVARAVTVTFCGFSARHQASHSNGSRFAAVTECDLAKNHQRTQRTFGHIAGWLFWWVAPVVHPHSQGVQCRHSCGAATSKMTVEQTMLTKLIRVSYNQIIRCCPIHLS